MIIELGSAGSVCGVSLRGQSASTRTGKVFLQKLLECRLLLQCWSVFYYCNVGVSFIIAMLECLLLLQCWSVFYYCNVGVSSIIAVLECRLLLLECLLLLQCWSVIYYCSVGIYYCYVGVSWSVTVRSVAPTMLQMKMSIM